MSKPIVLIFGAGKNIGAATARAFSAKGYRVAQAARSANPAGSEDNNLFLTADLSKIGAVSDVFTSVRKTWGEPSVVLYNAAAVHFSNISDPFTVTEEEFAQDIAINTTSAYAALKEALASFQTLPDSAAKTFFYTGNKLNVPGVVMPQLFTLGVGKAATSHIIESAVATQAYTDKGYKFYYVDERTPEGNPVQPVDGDAHGAFFVSLLDGDEEVPWRATFVKGKGYSKF